MRGRLMCGAAAIALVTSWGGAVQAADPVATSVNYDWTGVYVGAHGGIGGGHYTGGRELDQGDPFDPPELAKDLNLTGIVGGLHVGYNHQFNRNANAEHDIVVGIEADASFPHWDDTIIDNAQISDEEGISGSIDLLASVRGRLGVARDRRLLYLTGGLAIPRATFRSFENDDFYDLAFGNIGGVIGAGVEIASLNDRVSFRAEALYYCFNERRADASVEGDTDEGGDFAKLTGAFVARVGVSVKLGQ